MLKDFFFINAHFWALTALGGDWQLLPKLVSILGKSFGFCLVSADEYYIDVREEKGEKRQNSGSMEGCA